MVRVYYIVGILFALGNILWPVLGDPRAFYIPLALHLLIGTCCIRWSRGNYTKADEYFLDYVLLLGAGNVIKQVFYTSDMVKQVNDYVWGGMVTIWLLIMLIRWEIQRQRS